MSGYMKVGAMMHVLLLSQGLGSDPRRQARAMHEDVVASPCTIVFSLDLISNNKKLLNFN